uniref:Receptor ligand binding region domain-containing protein n=1 Tax=Strigamia maritima TaxID=126957 RepID=T1IU70_STRMM
MCCWYLDSFIMGSFANFVVLTILSGVTQFHPVVTEKKESDTDVNIVAIFQTADEKFAAELKDTFSKQETASGLKFIITVALLDEKLELKCFETVCNTIKTGVSIVLDFTWKGFKEVADACLRLGIPYQRIDTTIGQFVRAADNYLESRTITDAVLIFADEKELHQGLNYLIGNSVIRVLVLSQLDKDIAANLTKLKPAPSNYVVFGKGGYLQDVVKQARASSLIKKDSKWFLVYEDFNSNDKPDLSPEKATITYIQPRKDLCCQFLSKSGTTCSCQPLALASFNDIVNLNNILQVNLELDILLDQNLKSDRMIE